MAGYSGTPLVKKLGIRENQAIFFINPPKNFRNILGKLPTGIRERKRLSGQIDFIHAFAESSRQLDDCVTRAKKVLTKSGTLWLSWPKKSSGVPTDLSGESVRRCGLRHGLVDVKVCAVDDTWSGLKFVYRLRDR